MHTCVSITRGWNKKLIWTGYAGRSSYVMNGHLRFLTWCYIVKTIKNTIAPIIVGVLAGFVRFVNLDDSNRSRCSMLQKWADFIAAASSIVLSVPKKKSSVENKHEWVRKQVMPTIAGLLYAYGGDMSAVFGDLGVQFNRNSWKTGKCLSVPLTIWSKCKKRKALGYGK